ncbi:GntR family transcriptional regulator [Mycobacteroides abscessus]|uniref:GntR family transcriptional regulator n=1 Tax=Mycobacteroides abscessus TaxID=36809 RepID=A0ABD7HNE1_9MYCO|nr:GntR family transcriptional regulator [Mycobacteroides abscessus]RIT36773.1 GntR family transcriptional regulator [Mycobacteroides abscessus]
MPQLAKIDPSADRAPFRQIADILREGITSGQLAPGERLAPEAEMLEHFGVSRMTWRHALQELRTEGLVVSARGIGVFVREKAPVRRLSSDRFARRYRQEGDAAFSAEAKSTGFSAEVDTVVISREQPSAAIAGRLKLTGDAQVVVRSRRYLADGRPVQTAVSYIPVAFAEGTAIEQENSGPGGIYARLEENGHLLGSFNEEVGARMPTPEERQALDIEAGIPVLTVARTAYDTDGVPVEVCEHVMISDAYLLDYTFPAT